MPVECPVNFDHPENQGVLKYLKEKNRYPEAPMSMGLEQAHTLKLHTHPELIEYFWNTGMATQGQRWIVHSFPVLVNPDTGIIYGFTRGTHLILLRLPEEEKARADEATYVEWKRTNEHFRRLGKATEPRFDPSVIGEDWALIHFYGKKDSFFEPAYQYAAQETKPEKRASKAVVPAPQQQVDLTHVEAEAKQSRRPTIGFAVMVLVFALLVFVMIWALVQPERITSASLRTLAIYAGLSVILLGAYFMRRSQP